VVRSGVEGNEFAHGHGMRRCRQRGPRKAHIQHVLTAIAVNIERLSAQTYGLPGQADEDTLTVTGPLRPRARGPFPVSGTAGFPSVFGRGLEPSAATADPQDLSRRRLETFRQNAATLDAPL
jgi:hypothetical protein